MNAGRYLRGVFNALGGRGDYTDQVTAAAEAQAAGLSGDRRAAIFEAIAGTMERAFAQGRLAGGDERMRAAVSPAILAGVGRCLVDRGEWAAVVERVRGSWLIRPAASWEIVGGQRSDNPDDWTYRLHCQAPGAQILRNRPRRSVAHVITRASAAAPYIGRGLWGLVANTADAVAASESRLREELAAVTGHLVAPEGVRTKEQQKEVKEDLQGLRGGLGVLRSRLNPHGGQRAGGFNVHRIGANPPEQLGVLRGQSAELMALAAGLPGSFVRGGRGSEQRESLRLFLFVTLTALGGLLSAELSRVFGEPVTLEFSRLTAADLGGRARAVKQLTDAGVDLERALSLSGFRE